MEWLQSNWPALVGFLSSPAVLLGLTLLSVVTFVASLIGASWAVRRLPVDFLRTEHERRPRPTGLGWVLRNLVGGVLFCLGILMLVLPGQGLLTLLAALALMDFPGKRRLERRLLSLSRVLSAVNRLRQRAGQPPLLPPAPHAGSTPAGDGRK